ncbi:Vacuolar cation/proton exchanger 5 [Cyphellophora attinorum]|uniref:Vacuolar cation/proton exchanger 5 n=1 Tax=Cyphellophora attinorum TaxID=1664694 RepID=A0A0N1NW89_9EURO|nr:Vacuolar cation/proton exchanger 5 [Phialophora attinorum]KPI35580.1 Vacuolar cation/proton exchanger 5 [Phialophora attinorum]
MANNQSPDESRPLLSNGHGTDGQEHEDAGFLTIHHEGESHRSGFHPQHFLRITWRSSCTASKYVNVLWPFAIIAIVLKIAVPHAGLWIFAMSYIAMVPAANLVGFAGQELARKLPKVAGILIETAFGGIVEIVLFIVLIAKHKPNQEGENGDEGNLVPVIQAAILGSILTNLLLCLGLCFWIGGLRQQTQSFHAVISERLLLGPQIRDHLPPHALHRPPIYAAKFTKEKLDNDVQRISQATSIILIIAFVVYILYNARSQHSIFDEVLEADEHKDADHAEDLAKAKYTFTECSVALIFAVALVTILAYFLVEEIEEVVAAGVPDQFLGLIMLPLVEKAAEHLTAIDEAWDHQMNFALYHCLGPSIQTALFNAPLVVLVGWAMGKPDMDLNFEIFMIALLVLAILAVANFLRDGQSNYLEGFLLVMIYAIVAIASWFYPNPDVATSNGIQEALGSGFVVVK